MNYLKAATYQTYKALLSLFRIKTLGARVLVIRHEEEVLLVNHTYLPGWYTIGGGIDAKETGIEAAVRELYEETGIVPTQDLELFGFYYNPHQGRDDYIALYVCKHFREEKVKSGEIAEARWFHLDNLPEDATPATRRRVAEYRDQAQVSDRW